MHTYEFNGTGTQKILVIAGVHGNELTPIVVVDHLRRIIEENKGVDNSNYSKFTILNVVNESGIKNRTRDFISGFTNDINRKFADNMDIDIECIRKYINDADIVIDIHSSPSCTPFFLINQDMYANSYVEFMEYNNLPYLLRYSNASTIKKYALEIGKKAFTLELNRIGVVNISEVDESINLLCKSLNLMRYLFVTKETPKYEPYKEVFTHHTGVMLYNKNDMLGKEFEGNEDTVVITVLKIEDMSFEVIKYKSESKYRVICIGDGDFVDPSLSYMFIQPSNK